MAMFRSLLTITSLLSGFALAQLTRDPEAEEASGPTEEAPGQADTPTEGAIDEAAGSLVAVMAEVPSTEAVGEELAVDDLEEPAPDQTPSRRVRALVIAGVAAVVGLGLGYLAIRRLRPQLLADVSIEPIRSVALPAVEIHLPDLAELRRSRFAVLEGDTIGSVAPAIRSAVASALATSLAALAAARR
jgi:hypothetical protein